MVITALVGSLAIAACGGAGVDRSSADGGPGGPSGGTEGTATHLTVGVAFWHRGYKVTLGDAVIVPGTAGASVERVVTIGATFQNLGVDAGQFPSAMVLSSGGRHYTETAEQHEVPTVPGQAAGEGTIAFEADERFQLTDAVLTIGESDERQAVVPLAKPQSVVSLEPRTINVSGKAYAGPKVYATISSVDLRADNPRVHREIGSGYEWMLLHFTATNDSAAGMAILYEFDQRLVLPDGSAVSTSSSSCGNAQLHPGPYSTARDGVACFEVPVPVGGTYTYDISDSDSPGFTFTIN